MKYIEEFRDGDRVQGVYLCKSKIRATKKNGDPYESVNLQDKTGSIDAKIWSPDSPGIKSYDAMDYIHITGEIKNFNGTLQMSLSYVEKEVLNSITEKTKILILPFPNNPTGAILEKDELDKIAKICIEKDIYVISDEIYSELTYTKGHNSIVQCAGMKERTVLINGFSKAYAMTGWRLGYAAAPKEIMEQMIKIHQFAIMCAPTTSQYAAIEALKNGDKDVETMRNSYDQRRRFLLNEFKRMEIPCFEPYGAFYVFPNIQKFGMTSEEFALKLLEAEKVAVVPGTAFGDCGEGFLRISYAYSLDNIKEALGRIERFVKTL